MTHTLTVNDYTFTTDGSVLLCKDHPYAMNIIKTMTSDDVFTLSDFIMHTMPWVSRDHKETIHDGIKEVIYPYCNDDGVLDGKKENLRQWETMSREQMLAGRENNIFIQNATEDHMRENAARNIVDARDFLDGIRKDPNVMFFDGNELEDTKDISVELITAIDYIVKSMHPYLHEHSSYSLIDDFYDPKYHTMFTQQSLSARTHKEFVTACFGGYFKGACDGVEPRTIASMGNELPKSIPLEHKVTIAETFSWEISDYVVMVLNEPEIKLSSQRLLNWIDKYGVNQVNDTLSMLFDCADCPYIDTVSSESNMLSVRNKCVEKLNVVFEKKNTDINMSPCDLGREPDDFWQGHAVTLVRTAIELQSIGENMEICIGGKNYQDKMHEGLAEFYIVDYNGRQYAVECVGGQVKEARSVRNTMPPDTISVNEAMNDYLSHHQKNKEKQLCH